MSQNTIPLSEQDAINLEEANNIDTGIYTRIATSIGGWVWVNATLYPELAQKYYSGELTGGEPAPAGVSFRALPYVTSTTTTSTTQQQPLVNYTNGYPIVVTVVGLEAPVTDKFNINVRINPQLADVQTKELNYPFAVNTIPITVNLSDPIIETSFPFLMEAINTYVDEDRNLKTLLNYGEDRQSVVLSYRYGPVDASGIRSIQLKLLQPVPDDIVENSSLFLSREVAKTLIDKVRIRFAQPVDATPYLRPKNLLANSNVDTGKYVNNVTMKTLSLSSGSVGAFDPDKNYTFEDQIFRRWYSDDFNSTELNLDFTDYNNFIFYSSAAMRLAAFGEKLNSIQRIEYQRKQFISSSTYSVSTASAAYVFVQEKTAEYAKQKEDIIRAFDRYEQYLFYTPSGSNLPYTASAYYADNGYEYNQFSYWPKDSNNEILPLTNAVAEEWYNTQMEIATRYDQFNVNNLTNTIPDHVLEDEDNSPYVTFVSLVAHIFDNLKPYIDQYPNIYSRNLNPNEELSKDLINDIAESFGFRLPTVDATYELAESIISSAPEQSKRDLAAEIYKRLLHNFPFFAKAKGTKFALESFIRTFGISPQILTVRESGVPTTSSYRVIDEYTTGLRFDSSTSTYINVPLSASLRAPTTLQFNISTETDSEATLVTGDNVWAIDILPHPTISNFGKILLVSGSGRSTILSSSYHEILNDELLSIAVQVDGSQTSMHLYKTEGDDLLIEDVITENSQFSSLWNTTQFMYVGGVGSMVNGRFNGILDEFRLWNSPLSAEVLLNTAFDPGSNAGDTYSDASDKLLVQLSFNKVFADILEASSSLVNESPYKDITDSPSLETLFCIGITTSSFERYSRTIKQEMVLAGSSGYVTNKIKVLDTPQFIDSGTGPRLYRSKSIVSPEQKMMQRGRNKVIVAASPTELVNQNIIRNFGLENINAVLGSPTTMYTQFDKSLELLKKHYTQYYYVDVNTNKFIRTVSQVASVMNQVMEYFIPSKATLLSGVIIEPNILEQVKIPPVKNIRTYGKGTRKTQNAAASLQTLKPDYGATFNVSDDIDVLDNASTAASFNTFKSQLDGDDIYKVGGSYSNMTSSIETFSTLNASIQKLNTAIEMVDELNVNSVYSTQKLTLEMPELYEMDASISRLKTTISENLIENADIKSEFASYKAFIDTQNDKTKPTGSFVSIGVTDASTGKIAPIVIDIGLGDMNKVGYYDVNNGRAGAEPYNRLYPRKLFQSEINTERLGGNTSIYIPALYAIPPSADFNDYGVYTYFSNDLGIYYFPVIVKTPAFNNPLNYQWDMENQTFIDVPTWNYGARFNLYDVVYQDVDSSYSEYLGDLTQNAKAGNGRYYVFKTRASYTNPQDGSSFYSGSVPSYTPPSLDKENWEVLRFTPIRKLVPRRVVFDTFTITNPELNNFKVTTVSIDRIVNEPTRYLDNRVIPAIQPNSQVTGEVSIQNISILFGLQTNISSIRVRLYRTPEQRDLDINRAFNQFPTGEHGVLIDTILDTDNVVDIKNPFTLLVSDSNPPNGKLYYTIDNLDNTVKLGGSLVFYYYAIELQPRVPLGYLRKHYRYFRDNSTATKRRNYEGCKNTIDTTIDGLPPVQIFLSEGTEVTVSSGNSENEIVTGGGGTLSVT